MPLAQEDFNEVTEYVKGNIVSWLSEDGFDIGSSSVLYGIDFRERMIRLEEELKHQRELMQQGFDLVNIRMQEQREDMNKHFEEQRQDMNQRFEKVDQRFEKVDQRFEKVDQRFEEQAKRIDRFMVWSFGMNVTAVVIIISAIKYL